MLSPLIVRMRIAHSAVTQRPTDMDLSRSPESYFAMFGLVWLIYAHMGNY